ncbi:type II toxin-antitoxin system HicB family antitoxin [Pannus brasiliensis CCIBt3594]|uniref:Type II toxin-antitoxin system HicB family antitoxin n=1 Tax=Pannus brasiliensis CCIBt3594 TaxID=1427578 RepID=A0AAW9QMT3_9CHRO
MNHHYSITIQWSEEDNKFVAHLPEFSPYARTHGDTRNEALHNAIEVFELLIEDYTARGKELPIPHSIENNLANL